MILRIEADARIDILAAHDWYEDKRRGLGAEFEASIDQGLRKILENPAACREVASGVRRRIVMRFPYQIFYRATEDLLSVIAVLHAAQHPDAWQERLGE